MRPRLRFISHGLKNGPLPKADLYLDCRVLVNPMRQARLGGELSEIMKWIKEQNADVVDYFTHLIHFALKQIPDRRRNHSDPYHNPFTICTLCAYGQHRSVAMKRILHEICAEGYMVEPLM